MNTKKKSIEKLITSNRKIRFLLLIIIATVIITCLNPVSNSSYKAYAGSVCKEIRGDSHTTTIFKVTTGKGWFFGGWFYLRQTKGQMVFQNWIGSEKTHKIYAIYNVTVTNARTGKSKEYVWNGKSRGIWLDRKSTFYIKVNPWSYNQYFSKYFLYGAAQGWDTNYSIPKWKVTREANIKLCTL